MTKQEFQRKMKDVYPEKEIEFRHNEVDNLAIIDDFVFRSPVHSDHVYMFWPNGKSAGWSEAVEKA